MTDHQGDHTVQARRKLRANFEAGMVITSYDAQSSYFQSSGDLHEKFTRATANHFHQIRYTKPYLEYEPLEAGPSKNLEGASRLCVSRGFLHTYSYLAVRTTNIRRFFLLASAFFFSFFCILLVIYYSLSPRRYFIYIAESRHARRIQVAIIQQN